MSDSRKPMTSLTSPVTNKSIVGFTCVLLVVVAARAAPHQPLTTGAKGDKKTLASRCDPKAAVSAMSLCKTSRHRLSLASHTHDSVKLCGALRRYTHCMAPRLQYCKGAIRMAFDVIRSQYANHYKCSIALEETDQGKPTHFYDSSSLPHLVPVGNMDPLTVAKYPLATTTDATRDGFYHHNTQNNNNKYENISSPPTPIIITHPVGVAPETTSATITKNNSTNITTGIAKRSNTVVTMMPTLVDHDHALKQDPSINHTYEGSSNISNITHTTTTRKVPTTTFSNQSDISNVTIILFDPAHIDSGSTTFHHHKTFFTILIAILPGVASNLSF